MARENDNNVEVIDLKIVDIKMITILMVMNVTTIQ